MDEGSIKRAETLMIQNSRIPMLCFNCFLFQHQHYLKPIVTSNTEDASVLFRQTINIRCKTISWCQSMRR
ncbi:hypothetical protein EUGRSUZ_A00952 [Eucalyptus grandis]|uniref:Uncharacterized protein n=2 Tax=Eucalyptus grandis TaxID=71139 RepID=A0ACC3M0E0_EUCGR|nr:hypothetical protein EUGRSUZ_A00952 [Eucalyptus grandis]